MSQKVIRCSTPDLAWHIIPEEKVTSSCIVSQCNCLVWANKLPKVFELVRKSSYNKIYSNFTLKKYVFFCLTGQKIWQALQKTQMSCWHEINLSLKSIFWMSCLEIYSCPAVQNQWFVFNACFMFWRKTNLKRIMLTCEVSGQRRVWIYVPFLLNENINKRQLRRLELNSGL